MPNLIATEQIKRPAWRLRSTRPQYEALDQGGQPYLRAAQTIGELPSPNERLEALELSTPVIEKIIGIPALRTISFGDMVFRTFGFKSTKEVRNHPYEQLLLTPGSDLPLDYAEETLGGLVEDIAQLRKSPFPHASTK
jgi:hypothetical protein